LEQHSSQKSETRFIVSGAGFLDPSRQASAPLEVSLVHFARITIGDNSLPPASSGIGDVVISRRRLVPPSQAENIRPLGNP
jgi:hypothetical protein